MSPCGGDPVGEASVDIAGRLRGLGLRLPDLKRVAVLRDVDNRSSGFEWTALDLAARQLGMTLLPRRN
jgi:hypothetical protein